MMIRFPRLNPIPGRNLPALRISLIYAVFSVLWILFSDQLLLLLVTDPDLMIQIQMVKGWAFVLTTSLIIYVLLQREIVRLVRAERALSGKEHDYREVFNATNEGIAIHDALTGSIVDVNMTFQKMFGYTLQEIQDLTVQDLSLGNPYSQVEAEERIQLAVTEGPQMFEWRSRRRNGELFWAEVTLKKVRLGDRERVIAVVRDIDDRKKAEEKSVEYEQRFQQAQKMEAIGTLAGGVAHDFNNILSAVLGYTELARTEIPLESPAVRHLQEVTRAGIRAKDLVRQILTFSRHNQPEHVPLLVQSIIREAMKLLRASISTSIDITVEIDDRCGPVLADPTQIHQVVMNLCTNAYYAMREKGGTLAVRLDLVELADGGIEGAISSLPAGSYIRLTVADTGTGMTPAVVKKIFDPYFTTKVMGEGTGMGLSVVHGIVSSLGGSIAVRSVVDVGTTFDVYIPSNQVVMVGEVQAEVQESTGSGRILLVDDEEALTELGKMMLEIAGYSVVAVTDSSRALKLFSKEHGSFDLIITDMNMPHIDGLSLIRACRKLEPTIPVILCTGYSDLVDRERALSEGVNDFMLKPFARAELAASVGKVMRNSREGRP